MEAPDSVLELSDGALLQTAAYSGAPARQSLLA